MRRLPISLALFATVLLIGVVSPWGRAEPATAPSESVRSSTRPATGTELSQPATRPAVPVAKVVKDVNGEDCRPFDVAGGKAAVVFFLAHDCPISNSYAPEIGRIYQEFAPAGFRFAIVHPYAELSAADAKKHAAEFRLPGRIIISDSLAGPVGAKVTPEVAVIDPDGRVIYRGRIDDRWVGYAKARVEPNERDLRNVLDAVRAGKPVQLKETAAVGCPI